MKTLTIITSFFTFYFCFFTLLSCNKKFDAPPPYSPPKIQSTLTIEQLKAMHVTGSNETINTDNIIEGIVIANDSSGNFYKQIIIEDSTAGIAVNIDDYNLYTSYPEGRIVFIKLKGLILYDDNKLIEIGGSKDVTGAITPIASPLKDDYVIKGNYGNVVKPKIVDITELNDAYQNMLIQLNDFEFDDVDTSKIYADTSSSKNAISYSLRNCSNKTITLRTSGFCSFAGINIPNGNGSITAIYSVYNSSKQIFIRDTADVQFNATRCNGGPAVQTSIANIRSMYNRSDIKLGAYKIGGVVISDASAKNIASGSIILQDGNAGIAVYFGGTITYNVGDSIVLDVTGDSLQNYNGSLEIKTTYGSIKPTPIATGKVITPKVITIAELSNNLSTIENTLVKIVKAKASGSVIYSGNNVLSDASGNITMFTSSSAIFASNSVPTDTSDWVGYAKYFGSTKEFQIRNTNDVTTSITNNNPGDGIELSSSPFTINFDELSNDLPKGVLIKTSASSTSLGTDATFSSSTSSWSNSSSGFKNYASATGLIASTNSTDQNNSTNRALGVKQSGTNGFDPGAAVVFEINNTSNKRNLLLNFLLQSLDSVGRTTNWKVDYALGDNPTSFTSVSTSPSTLITGPTFSSTPVTINFGTALDNKDEKVWIRIVTLDATTGSGSRAASAIDDISIKWD